MLTEEKEQQAFDGFKFQLGDLVRYKTDVKGEELRFERLRRESFWNGVSIPDPKVGQITSRQLWQAANGIYEHVYGVWGSGVSRLITLESEIELA